ncbi:MAG: MFS transporter [Verrucomicrobia bacterium]|nr:MFS transporter [Verrucomicrobiota bacterium]
MARAWLTVALLWFVACLNYLDRVMITTMRESLVGAIPMTDAQFGLLTSVFLWVYGLLSPFAGFLADRFSRGRVVLASLFVWSAITWLTGQAQTFNQLLAARALMGVSEACYIPAALALIMDYHRGPTRSLATGVHMSGIMVGSGLGGLGGWLAERHEWSYAFNLFGLIGIAYSVVLAFLLKDAPRDRAAAASAGPGADRVRFLAAVASLFSAGSFYLVLAYWGLIGLVGWALVGWMPTFLSERFELSQGVAGLSATGYLQGAALAGVLLGGAWADRWSRTNERGRIYVPMIGLCAAAPGIFVAARTGLLPIAIGGLVLYGIARAFTDANMMPILCLVSDPRYRATGYGILNLFSCVVGGVTIYAGGALRDAQVNLTFLFQAAALSMLVCAALLAMVKPAPQPQPET